MENNKNNMKKSSLEIFDSSNDSIIEGNVCDQSRNEKMVCEEEPIFSEDKQTTIKRNSLYTKKVSEDFHSPLSSNILDLHFPNVSKRLFKDTSSHEFLIPNSPNYVNNFLSPDCDYSYSQKRDSNFFDTLLKNPFNSNKSTCAQKLNFEKFLVQNESQNDTEKAKHFEMKEGSFENKIFSSSSDSFHSGKSCESLENSLYQPTKSFRKSLIKKRKRKFHKIKQNNGIEGSIKATPNKEEKRAGCTCKKSRCLKLYCECFSEGKTCDGSCQCLDCLNIEGNEEQRNVKMNEMKTKNPDKFESGSKSMKGCNCTKSECLKRYCECYVTGKTCSVLCRCRDCKNTASKENIDKGEVVDFENSQIENDIIPEIQTRYSLYKIHTISIEILNNQIFIDENYQFPKEASFKKVTPRKLFESVKQIVPKKKIFMTSPGQMTTCEKSSKKPRVSLIRKRVKKIQRN